MNRVGICVPTGGDVKTKFLASLIDMLNCTETAFYFYTCEGCLVPKNRQQLVQKALEDGCSHILFIDADMVFPPDLIDGLIKHDEDVVAINCTGRKFPIRYMAESDFKQVVTTAESTGLQEVNRVGTGVMMIKSVVFKRIKKPWFVLGYNPNTDEYTGEDYWFCHQCREEGIKIYIDHDLSKKVGHVGDYIYGR